MAARQNLFRSLPRRLWRLAASRTLTAVLLSTLLLLLLGSLLLPQQPGGIDEAGRQTWEAVARQRYGERYDLYQQLGLFAIPRTPLFLALAAALLLNAMACTVDRLGALWRALTRRPAVRLPDAAYSSPDYQVEGINPRAARRALRRPLWRLWSVPGPPDHFYSATWRLAPLGTLLTHLGLFLFALSALLHGPLAWRERLRLDAGAAEPTALARRPWCSAAYAGWRVAERPGGRNLVEGRIRVAWAGGTQEGWLGPAAPLAAGGARFHLASHGLVLRVTAYPEDGGRPAEITPADDGPEGGGGERPALIHYPEGTTARSFEITFSPTWYVTVAPTPATLAGLRMEPLAVRVEQEGRLVFAGVVASDEYLELPGGKLLLHGERYLEVDAVYDPGAGPFLAGGFLLTLGSGMGLLVPSRRLWARREEDGTLRVRLGMDAEAARETAACLARRLERAGRGRR